MKKIELRSLEGIKKELKDVTILTHITVTDDLEDKYVIMGVEEYEKLKRDAKCYEYTIDEDISMSEKYDSLHLNLNQDEVKKLRKTLLKK